MPRWGIAGDHLPCIKAEDRNVILTVQSHQLIAAELYYPQGRLPRRLEADTDPLLAIDVDDTLVMLGFGGADGKEGLDGIVGEGGDLGVHAIAGELDWLAGHAGQQAEGGRTSSRRKSSGKTP